jgi:hypothetical protein
MSQREAVKVIGDILASELDLRTTGETAQIMLTNERFNIPPTDDLYIALSYVSGKPIANNNYFDGNAALETQQVVMFYQIQIDIMSFDSSARTRKEEVYQALRSIFAESQMESNNMQLGRMPASFADASSLEESKRLNRYTMTIAVTALLTKQKSVDSTFDAFPFEYIENGGPVSPILNPEDPFNG